MRYLFSIIIISILTYSCIDKKSNLKTELLESSKQEIKGKVLRLSISEMLDLYIKEYPIPKKSINNLYHYKLAFNEDKFTIMRIDFPAPKEIETELKGMFYYKDSIAISIFDKKNVDSSRFYNNYFNQNLETKIVSYKNKQMFDETFPPIWKYKVCGNKFFLIQKDTIWKVWK